MRGDVGLMSWGQRYERLLGVFESGGKQVLGLRSVGCRYFAAAMVLSIGTGGSACASGGTATGSDGVWREDIGRITKATVAAGLDRVVRRHTLKVDRQEDRPREFYYELAWIPRDVTSEEEIFGVTDARNRIVIRGRSGASGDLYRVMWELENEVASVANPEWHSGRIPESVIARFRPVLADLNMEMRTGLQR